MHISILRNIHMEYVSKGTIKTWMLYLSFDFNKYGSKAIMWVANESRGSIESYERLWIHNGFLISNGNLNMVLIPGSTKGGLNHIPKSRFSSWNKEEFESVIEKFSKHNKFIKKIIQTQWVKVGHLREWDVQMESGRKVFIKLRQGVG